MNLRGAYYVRFFIVLLLVVFCFSESFGWIYRYNGPDNQHDRLDCMCYGDDGMVYAVGFRNQDWPDNPGDFTVVSLTDTGTERWMYSYPLTDFSLLYSIVWGGDGNIYACGDSVVASLTPGGVERWVYTQQSAVSIVYGADGNIYCCGDENVTSLTSDGAERWVHHGLDRNYEIIYAPDGDIYVSGKDDDLFKVQSLTSGGTERWTYQYNGSLQDDWGFAITVDEDGDIYAGGYAKTDHDKDALVVKLSSSGSEQWSYLYTSPGYYFDAVVDLKIGPHGNLYATGCGGYNAFQRDIIAMSFTPEGERRWYFNYNGPNGSFDNAYEIIYGNDGNVYVSGASTGIATYDDFTVIKLTAFGHKCWVYRYNNTPVGFVDEARSSVFGSDGNLYMCGNTSNADWNEDFLIIGFNPGFTGISDMSTDPEELVFDFSSDTRMFSSDFKITSKASVNPSVEPLLSKKLQHALDGELIPVMVVLSEQPDLKALESEILDLHKIDKRQWLNPQLKALSLRSQKEVRALLNEKAREGMAEDVTPLWIINAVAARVTKQVVSELTGIHGISCIWYDDTYFHALDEVGNGCREGLPDREIVWGVQQIQADAVWVQGYTGEGIIVGVLDTGVSTAHQDLNDHCWDGGTLYPSHGWDFVNDDQWPSDDNGHGTHVAGTIAGDGTAGSQTGVAPDAQIMALKVLNAAGAGAFSWVAEAVQFAIDHNADVLNMSFGADSASSAAKEYARDMCKIAYLADVPLAVSAGNGIPGLPGHYPAPYDIYTPGDVPAPWYAPNGGNNAVITVGATDDDDDIAGFSSYGPTEWNTANIYGDYPYPPGLMKPDVSAPGVAIKSLLYNVMDGYTIMNGTSMAAPHLAGTIALMLEKNRFLTCREIDSLLETSAVDFGAPGRDGYYGAGRINALDAVNSIEPSIAEEGEFWVMNSSSATANLEFDMPTWQAGWIKEALPASYVVGSGQSTAVKVYIDTSGLAPGTYVDTLWFNSNDPDNNPYPEPITLILGPLGIEFSYFTADVKDAGILLTWRTESETNILEWWLDRSFRQDDSYDRIATITGKGTSSTPATYHWLDDGVSMGRNHFYRLGGVDVHGNVTWHGPISARIPDDFAELVLRQNSPNPFRDFTRICYHLPWKAFTRLSIYDATGRLVRTLVCEEQESGSHGISWDGKDDAGVALPAGVYYVRLSQNNTAQTRKLLRIK